MPIVAADIAYRMSGGAANATPLLSIGGIKSANAMPAGILDDVSGAESAAGDINYRCIYVHNAHATLTLQAARIWIQANTPSADTTIDIGLGAAAVNATETAVANEATAPAAVAFSAPANFAAGLVIGDIPPGQHKAVWLRRTVNAAAAASADTFTLRVQGDTAA
jgi:hypothetical protein